MQNFSQPISSLLRALGFVLTRRGCGEGRKRCDETAVDILFMGGDALLLVTQGFSFATIVGMSGDVGRDESCSVVACSTRVVSEARKAARKES